MKWTILGAATALAVAMPLATATPSMAQGRDGGVNIGNGFRSYGAGGVLRSGGGGGGGHIGGGGRPGGGGHIGGGGGRPGGGWHGGGRPGGGWHGGHHRGGGGFFPGFAAGAVIGGALAAPYAYGGGYPYGYYDDDYYVDAPAVTVAPGGDSVAYCQSRFKSYDVRSGTYLGYDGQRHPCP